MASVKIASWNINSVRFRIEIVEQFRRGEAPDILCLQETKCPNDQFPSKPLKALGYEHIVMHGQKGYHGVATISRLPLTEIVERRDYCGVGDARHVSVVFHHRGKSIRLHNFYVPAGGDEPDRKINPKFGHKLDFIEEMKLLHAEAEAGVSSVLVGDLNIDEAAELVALAWLGRGDYDGSEWATAITAARDRVNRRTATYLLGMPMLGDWLEDGLEAIGA